jgi:hypothetical protein
MLLRNISFAAAVAGLLLAPAFALAKDNNKGGGNKSVHVNKTVHVQKSGNVRVNRNVNVRVSGNRTVHVVGRRYYGGTWYGARRHYWNGRWYAYGVGSCWLPTEIGYVWVCG